MTSRFACLSGRIPRERRRPRRHREWNDAAPDGRIGELYYKAITSTANEFIPEWKEVTTRRATGFPRFDQHIWFPAQATQLWYDDDGNLTEDGRWTYYWDAENRLVAMEPSPLSYGVQHPYMQVKFVYDWQGRRIARHFEVVKSATELFFISQRFLYDGWNVIAEFTAPTRESVELTRTQTYTWGLDLSGTLQGAGGVGGLLSVQTHDPLSSIHYPSYDGNGNIIAWTKDDGSAPVARREYDAFGNTLVAEGTAPCTFGFSTKMREEMTGLYYYGYRYYDPLTGRWPSRDPIEERGGINLYGFVGNNGIHTIDKNGLMKVQYMFITPPNTSVTGHHSPKTSTAGITYSIAQADCEAKACSVSCLVIAHSRINMNTAVYPAGTIKYKEALNHERIHVMSWTYKVKEQIIGPLLFEYSGPFDCPEQAVTAADKLNRDYNQKIAEVMHGGDHYGDPNQTIFSPKTPSTGYSYEGYGINLRVWSNHIERGKTGGSAQEGNLYYERNYQ